MSTKVAQLLDAKGRNVHSIEPDKSVFEAIGMMVEKNVGALLVMEGERLLGVFTERDYLRRVALEGRSSRDTALREVMTSELICAKPDDDLEHCMSLMTEERIRHLPVLEEGRLVGIISVGDIVKRLSTTRAKEVAALTGYIAGQYPG